MKTLSADEFKQQYGGGAVDSFNSTQPDPSAPLFEAIKNDLSERKNSLVTKDSPGYGGAEGAITGTMNNAGQIAGGLTDIAGETLTHLPGVGGAFKAAGDAIKGGFNAVTNKLSGTKFFSEAAAGLEPGNATEKSLKFASDAGVVAGTAAGAEQGLSLLSKVPSAVSKVSSVATDAVDAIPKPNVSGAGTYLKGAIRDIIPNKQNIIDDKIAKGLDLTSGDLGKITASTGNEVGRWLSDNNLIGTNKATTQAAIDAFGKQSYAAVRSEIAKVTETYRPTNVPSLVPSLKAIKESIQNVPGLEKENIELDNLLAKKEVTLGDVQKAKELMDEHFKLYNVLGDVAASRTKAGLANFRKDLQSFIEQRVEKTTKADIRQLNNNVSTARSLSDAITTRSQRGLTRTHISNRDIMTGLGLTYFGTPFVGLGYVLLKKLWESPTVRLRVARYVDQLNDAQKLKVSEQIQAGKIPADIKNIVGELPSPVE